MTMWTRTPLAFAALIAALALGACSDDDDPTGGNGEDPPPEAVTVEMKDNFFDQDEVRVAVGGKVTWVYAGDGRNHTTTSDDDLWNSGDMSTGDTFEWTFNDAGEFDYHCIPHQDDGMLGTVIVVEVD